MTLHILNGENSLAIFNTTTIPGDRMAWPEILCEGPIRPDIFSTESTYIRYDYLRETFGISKEQYESKVIRGLNKLRDIKKYDRIYLWFEYDLFCHVNLMAIVHALMAKLSDKQSFHLVIPKENEQDKLRALGEIDASEYISLYENAEALGDKHLKLLSDIWKAYFSDDPRALLPYIDYSDPTLPYIGQVILAHCRRFPSRDHGIDLLRINILKTIEENHFENRKALLHHILNNQGYYGFGDLQYELLIDELDPLIIQEDIWKLNPVGLSVLKGNIDYQEFKRQKVSLGGADSSRYRWWEEEKTFIPQYHESMAYS